MRSERTGRYRPLSHHEHQLILRCTAEQATAARKQLHYGSEGWHVARIVDRAQLPFDNWLTEGGPFLELDYQPDQSGPPVIRKVIDVDGNAYDGYVNLD